MKKLLLAVVVIAILAALVAPGALGFWLENNVRQQTGLTSELQPGTDATVQEFARGWFSSKVRQEVRIALPVPVQDSSVDGATQTVRILIDSDIRHGPVIGAALPGLALATSTVTIEVPGQRAWQLPGEIVTTFGVGGGGHSRYSSSAARIPIGDDGVVLDWGGADVSLNFDRGFTALSGDGRIERLAGALPDGSATFGPVDLEYALHRDNAQGFWLGKQHYQVATAAFSDLASGQSAEMQDIALRTDTSMKADVIDSSVEIRIAQIAGGPMTARALRMAVHLRDLDARHLARLQAMAERLQQHVVDSGASADPEMVATMLREPLEGIVRRGPGIKIETLEVMLPQGPVSMNLDLALERMPDDAAIDPVDVLTRMVGDGNLSVGKQVAQLITMLSPESAGYLDAAVAMGFLTDAGDSYATVLKYKGGLLTVNGNPVPLPLGALLSQ